MSKNNEASKGSILSQALAEDFQDRRDTAVAEIRGQLGVIHHERAIISEAQKRIAEAQKQINKANGVSTLTAKDVLA